jgi:Ca2+-binding EF-hand superfamily protein
MNHLLVAALPLLIVTSAAAQDAGGPPRGSNWNASQTKAEAEQRAQMVFEQLDANHDGVVSQDEINTFTKLMGDNPRIVGRVTRMFTDADANHDGKVSAAEAKAHADAAFDAADANHDGVLTPEERQAARQRAQDQAPQQ